MRNRPLSEMNLWLAIAAVATLAACGGDTSPSGSDTTGSASGAAAGGGRSGTFGGGSGSGTLGGGSGSGTFGGGSGSGTLGGGSGSGTFSGGSGSASGATSGMAGSGMAGSGMAGSGMAGSGMAGSGMAGSGMMAAGPPFAMAYAIIQAHCLPCHTPGMPAMMHSGFLKGMLDMSSADTAYTNLVGVAAMSMNCTGKGMRVVANDSAKSILYTKVAAAAVKTCGGKMPDGGGAKLTPAQLSTIQTWIDMGANK
jgi:hypothetical protein